MPSVAGGLFILYIFWLLPVKILIQEYTLSSYFLSNNIFIYISTGVFLTGPLILALLFRFWKTGWLWITWGLLFVLIITFLYPLVAPYNFGGFTDNLSLTPKLSLLGFSKIYYLLDVALIFLGAAVTGLLIRYKKNALAFTMFTVFYLAEFIGALSGQIKVDAKAQQNSKTQTFVFSKNHPNVLVLILDSTPALVMQDYLDNFLLKSQSLWKNDFTFYDNVVSLSTGGTPISVPTMFGGYEFSPQYQITASRDQKIHLIAENTNLKYLKYNNGWMFADIGVKKIARLLAPHADLFYETSDYQTMASPLPEALSVSFSATAFNSPIFFVPLYGSIPYFMRPLIAKEFTWSCAFPQKWVGTTSLWDFKAENTVAGIVRILHSNGAHGPNASEVYPSGIYSKDADSHMRDIILQSLHRSSGNMTQIFAYLKKMGIYNSTKIIITSDHGLINNTVSICNYIKNIDLDNLSYRFFDQDNLASIQLLSFFMVKDFQTSGTKMGKDSRFLSLGDLSPIILSAFTKTSNDYTRTLPPQRIFNVPILDWAVIHDWVGVPVNKNAAETFFKKRVTNNLWPYFEVRDTLTGNYSLKYWPADDIENLAIVEPSPK